MRKKLFVLPAVMMVAEATGICYFGKDLLHAAPAVEHLFRPGCNVKGNISTRTGTRIYHVPGQQRYNEIIISPQFGERWFCSERDAQSAGWIRSKV